MKKSRKSLFMNDRKKSQRNMIFLKVCVILAVSSSSLLAGNYMATKGVFLIKTSEAVKSVASQINDADKYSSLFMVRDTLMEKFDGDIDDETLLEGAIKGMTNSLNDPYTVFMNKNEFDKLMKQSSGSITGIGINVAALDNKIVILSPIKDSPAEKAGLQDNDIIEKINDVEYTGEQISDLINVISDSNGSEIKLTIKRGEGESFNVNIVPEKVKISVISGEMMDSDIGYIDIKSFMNENTTEDFKAKIDELKNQGMKGLILDLRENPGGLLSQAVGVASQFIEKDKIITYTIDKYDNKNESLSVGGEAIGMPLVVLVNDNSASASEVVTGALRDYEAATIVGNTTFGKGIVQQSIKFNNGIGGLKVTISKYYTPNGENIHKKGISPDIEVSTETRINEQQYDRNTDNQLNTATEKIKEKIGG